VHFGEGIDIGLAAPLIIDPAEADPFPFDREVTLVLDDWATGTSRPLPLTLAGTAGARGSAGGMMARMSMGPMGCGMASGGPATPLYDTMSINGKAYPATEPLSMRAGERVRLRLVNASAMHTHLVRLAGHAFQVTHTDGNPLQEAVEVDALPIAPAERYDVLVEARRPGVWPFYCAQPGHAAAGEQVMVVYEGHQGARPASPSVGAPMTRVWGYGLGQGRPFLPAASGPLREFHLVLSGGMMGTDAWTINGRRYPATAPLDLRQGDHVRVLLTNMSMASHPVHFHGQSFNVVAVNGARLPAPLVKDTVDVEPHMGSVLIEFPARFPGVWMLHCHKEVHVNGGMTTFVRVAAKT
jgi:FtsP/CotA-like multicopper oxidase with cupredoxin domain